MKILNVDKNLILSALIIIVAACQTAHRDDRDSKDETEEAVSESSVVYKSSEAIWAYDYNSETEEFEIKQMHPVDQDTLTAQAVVNIVNHTWPRVQVKLLGSSNDTLFISVPDSRVLTQQMGTAGAESYLISTTFSFTELKGINHVYFDFEEGDHAIPGVYSRDSWKKRN
jgi:hypothetical protein